MTSNEYEAIQYWTELTNVQFEWEYLSMTDWDTQINLKLAAGDIPDMIYSPLTTSQLRDLRRGRRHVPGLQRVHR